MQDSERSLDDWMQGIARAERAGNHAAAERLRQRAQAAITGEGSAMERVGAGMQDVIGGAGRLAGLTSKGDYAEQQRIAKMADPGGMGRMAGQLALTAPVAFAPGAATIPGAAAYGAGLGAVMEPEHPLQGAAMGAAGGAGAQFVAGKVLPAAMRQIAERTPFGERTKQRLADEAFAGLVPQGERAAAQQSLEAAAQRQPAIPGFQQTAGASLDATTPQAQRAILEAERTLRESGSPHGMGLREQRVDQFRAIQDAWEREFGGGKAQAAKSAAEDYYKQTRPTMQFRGAVPDAPEDFRPVLELLAKKKETAVGYHLKAIEGLEDTFKDALSKAVKSGEITPLHEWRKSQINDALDAMFSEGAKQSQKTARVTFKEVKDTFDAEMDRLLGGTKWSDFMEKYHDLSVAGRQAKAGEKKLTDLQSRAPEVGDVRNPTGLLSKLRGEFSDPGGAHPINKYNEPTYTLQGGNVLQGSLAELERAGQRVAPQGSATIANTQSMKLLKRASDAEAATAKPFSMGDIGTAGVAGFAIDPTAGIVAGLVSRGLAPARANALADIAKRLTQMFGDPAAAAQALARVNMPEADKQLVRLMLTPAAASAATGPR